MKKKGLSSKEKEFCRLYLNLADPEKAAEKAGFTGDSGKAGNTLLTRSDITEEIERLCALKKKSMSKMAAVGYQRLAFGSIADAVSLLYMENPSPDTLRKMDLFSVSEIKRPKDGSTLCKDADVPADSLELEIPHTGLPQLKTVELLRDGEAVFFGEIDEQIEEKSKNPHTELVARSSAARLIDSEAYPMSFLNPSAEDIFTRFAKPFGFTALKGENRLFNGRFTVSKGTSCFGVIKRFAAEVYSSFPRCEGDTIYIDGIKSDESIVLGERGIPFESLRISNLRCNRISEVFVKLKDGEGYTKSVKNSSASAEGICKVRYLNASLGSSANLSDADKILAEGERESFSAEVVCREFLGDALGKTAVLDDADEELYVSALRFTLNKNGGYTRLTLKRKEK